MATANHMHIRNIAVASDDHEAESEMSSMAQRGEKWLLQHIQHTAEVYGFFATLAQAARQQPEQELCWWETGAVRERRYQVGEQWHNLRPDALAGYRVGTKQFHFWLEWDRGTMNVRDLATKFASYAQYIDSRECAKEWSTLPLLVCVAPDIAQERRVQRVAQAKLAHFAGLALWTTTEVLFNECGPLAPIWSRGIPHRGQGAQPSSSHKQCLFDLIPEKKLM